MTRIGFVWLLCFQAGSLLPLAGQESGTITFNRDVAPILYAHCTKCHHANDIAPMSLLTYKEARPWAGAMKEAVVTRKMPPWQADPRYGHFANDQRLTPADIATIQKWAQGGALEGDPKDLPPVPSYSEGWKIGTPDAIVPIPADFHIKPGDQDQYVYLRAPTNFTEDRWISAVELRPGNRRIVHHAHVYVYVPKKVPVDAHAVAPDAFLKVDGLNHINPTMPVVDDGCETPDGGNVSGRKPEENNILGSYLPGKEPDIFPAGYARLIPKGAVLEFQIHYNSQSISKEELDRTSVGLVFSKEPPIQPLRRIDVSNYLFKIPAGDANHKVTACYTFPQAVNLMSYTAHMHLRGKDMKFEAVHPDGRREILASVPNYDFNWQTEYKLEQPVPVESGTKLIITAHFDNSANNRYNPDPTKTIRWGEPSYEEMMDGWFEFILPSEKKAEQEVTFNKNVAPIFFKNCVVCHHPNDIAPMSLLTYKEARPWAAAVRQAVVQRVMPPWHADPSVGHFINNTRLSTEEIATIDAWVKDGAKEGDPKDLPPAPTFTDAWHIKPDAVLTIPETTVAAGNQDDYEYIYVPTNFTEDEWVQAAEVVPGDRRVVHHATVSVVSAADAEKLIQSHGGAENVDQFHFRTGKVNHTKPDASVSDDGCVPSNNQTIKDWSGGYVNHVPAIYLPGHLAETRPSGYALKIPAGSYLQFQVHYSNRLAESVKDRTSIGLVFAKEPPNYEVAQYEIWNNWFEIPPGDGSHKVTSCFVLPKDVKAVAYTAHMHFRGKSMMTEAIYPDGRRLVLFNVPKYDFRWQETYFLKDQFVLPKGTKLFTTAFFDNSANNPLNPDPTKTVRWGEPSNEEMMGFWLAYADIHPLDQNLNAAKQKSVASVLKNEKPQ